MASSETENKELRRALSLLTSKVERNESILRSFFDMEIRLLGCNQLDELLNLILVEFRDYFHLTAVNLILFDPEGAARDLLADYVAPEPGHNLQFVNNQRLLYSLFPNKELRVGELSAPAKKLAFPGSPLVQSCALLPLVRHDCLIGSLHLGSNDPARYSEHFDYDYVGHLASVIAICIENCINQQNLKRLSIVDMLTKVHNRRAFDQDIIKELSRASRNSTPLSCLFVDLDYFKLVNDTYGHQIGDKVLRSVGKLLQDSLRKTDLVARFGGEEFAILLPRCDSVRAMEVAEGLRERILQMVVHCPEDKPFRISASIGVSSCNQAQLQIDDLNLLARTLIKAADDAVYEAKRNGRNRVEFCAMPTLPGSYPDSDRHSA